MNPDNFFKKAYLLIAIQNAILFVLAWIIVNIFPPDNTEFPLRGISIIIVIVIGATLTAYLLSRIVPSENFIEAYKAYRDTEYGKKMEGIKNGKR